MLLIQESVFEINRVQGFVCVQQRSGGGIAVTQKHVVQPLWNADVGVHQVSNARQDRLEVIFFRFAANEHVQSIVDVFASFFLLVHVHLILRRVERKRKDATRSGDGFRWLVVFAWVRIS